jgi:hypothetical protein
MAGSAGHATDQGDEPLVAIDLLPTQPRTTWWSGVSQAARPFDTVAPAAGGIPPHFPRYLEVGGGSGPVASAELAPG